MPLLKLDTTVTVSEERRGPLLNALSRIVSETIGKPESYVMVVVTEASIRMSGKDGNAAFVDLRSIGGLNAGVNRSLARKISDLLNASLGLPPERVFLNFTDVDGSQWGWNGATLG